MWEDILKAHRRRIKMMDLVNVYNSMRDGKKRTGWELAEINNMSINKMPFLFKKMLKRPKAYPNFKHEKLGGRMMDDLFYIEVDE
jgi:hypothetical protein